MDLSRAEELMDVMASIVDYPLFDDSPRLVLSSTLSISALQLAAAVRSLCGSGLLLGASVTLRSQFEALVRSVWVLHRATESEIGRLSAELSQESQQASKKTPMLSEMLTDLEKTPHIKNLIITLQEFKSSSWLPLNSFVHSGIHTVHWTKHGAHPQLLENIFRISNGLALLAFQGIGMLTGREQLQSVINAAAADFPSILPARR